MAIIVTCSSCRKDFEFQDDQGGKTLACTCGKMIFIPSMPENVPEGCVACPRCQKICEKENIICVNCGHNFKSGLSFRQEEEKRRKWEQATKLTFWDRFGKLIKAGIFVLALGTLALAVYYSVTKKAYGISPEHPLGRLALIEERFERMGLIRGDEKELDESFGRKAVQILYKRKQDGREEFSFGGSIFTVTDEKGKLCALGGDYSLGPVGGSKEGSFLYGYWIEQGGAKEPEFEEKSVGQGRLGYLLHTAGIETDSFRGRWEKIPTAGGLAGSSNSMLFILKDCSEDALRDTTALEIEEYIEELKSKMK